MPTIESMPDSPSTPQPLPGSAPSAPSGTTPSTPFGPTGAEVTDFHIGDEFGTAKRNLPPARIVLASIGIVALIVAIIAFHERPKPQGGGSIKLVTAVELPGQGPNRATLAAITFTVRNTADKSLWIHTLNGQLTCADGQTYEDEAASAVDLDRYYRIFPALKDGSEPPLSPETKLSPGSEKRATIVVSFPISKEAFDQRKSLTVNIQPYDQPLPVTLK